MGGCVSTREHKCSRRPATYVNEVIVEVQRHLRVHADIQAQKTAAMKEQIIEVQHSMKAQAKDEAQRLASVQEDMKVEVAQIELQTRKKLVEAQSCGDGKLADIQNEMSQKAEDIDVKLSKHNHGVADMQRSIRESVDASHKEIIALQSSVKADTTKLQQGLRVDHENTREALRDNANEIRANIDRNLSCFQANVQRELTDLKSHATRKMHRIETAFKQGQTETRREAVLFRKDESERYGQQQQRLKDQTLQMHRDAYVTAHGTQCEHGPFVFFGDKSQDTGYESTESQAQKRPHQSRKRSPDIGRTDDTQHQVEMERLKRQYNDQLKQKAGEIEKLQQKLQYKDSVQRYVMEPSRPGTVTIIANQTFSAGFSERPGTSEDICALVNVFAKLGFVIKTLPNQTSQNMIAAVKEIGTDPAYNTYSSAVLILLSHGDGQGIYGSDELPITNAFLLETLGGSKTLVGIPKLVFVQACRGSNKNRALKGGKTLSPEKNKKEEDEAETDFPVRVPTGVDLLVAQATIPEHVALRSPNSGSYFIQKFCAILEEGAEVMHVCDMLKMVTSGVVAERSNKKKTCCPSISHNSLRKNFYFTNK